MPLFRLSWSISMLLVLLVGLSACDSAEEEVTPLNAEEAMFRNQLLGSYRVNGVYQTTSVDSATIQVQPGDSEEFLVITGPGLPSFTITDWFKGFQDANDENDYIIFASVVGPNDGTVTWSAPLQEISFSVEIAQSGSSTTSLLAVTGRKIP